MSGLAEPLPALQAEHDWKTRSARALALDVANYRSVANIFKQGLDRQPLEAAPEPADLAPHVNVRGAHYTH